MTTLVLTVIGEDRSGLVSALAQAVADGGGNWERSHLAELGGKFAGIVQVSVPADRAQALAADLRPLAGLLDIAVHEAHEAAPRPATDARTVTVELLGNDAPGIVRDVAAVVARHGVSIAELVSSTREAPMAGGLLFEARLTADLPADADSEALRADLELLAGEMQVDISVGAPGAI